MSIKSYIEFINEIVKGDNPQQYTSDDGKLQNGNFVYSYHFKTPKTTYTVKFSNKNNSGDNVYNLSFQDDNSSEPNIITNNDEMNEIFSTIKEILIEFVPKCKPEIIEIKGAKKDNVERNQRILVYGNLLTRDLKSMFPKHVSKTQLFDKILLIFQKELYN